MACRRSRVLWSDGRIFLSHLLYLQPVSQASQRRLRLETRSDIRRIRVYRNYRCRLFAFDWPASRFIWPKTDDPALPRDIRTRIRVSLVDDYQPAPLLLDLLYPWTCRKWNHAACIFPSRFHMVLRAPRHGSLAGIFRSRRRCYDPAASCGMAVAERMVASCICRSWFSGSGCGLAACIA